MRAISSDSIALRSYPKHPVTQSTRSSQAMVIEAYDVDITEPVTTYSIPLPSFKIHELQESDEKLCLLCPRIKKGHLADSGYFIDKEDDLLW